MQNRFGVKDFFLFVLVALLGLMVLLSMVQEDRRFTEIRQLNAKFDEQQQTLVQIRQAIDRAARSGLTMRGPSDPASGGPAVAVGSGASADADRRAAEPWAEPGVPVERPPRVPFSIDPATYDDYAEGGEFVEIFEAQPAKMTPYMYQDVYGRRVIEGVVCESLAGLHPESLTLTAGLAEAWQLDPDGLWLRAKIDDRAVFSDGVPVKASDVKFTFDWVMNPQHDTERFRAVLNKIERVEVLSDKVVEFRFVDPMALNKITALRSLVVLPEHFYGALTPDQFNTGTGLLMGSGPYRPEVIGIDNQWAPPEDMVLIRNENYWAEKPPVERLRFTVISDNIARLTNYLNGAGDMMRASPEQFAEKREDPGFADEHHALAWTNMRSGFAFVGWNCGPRDGELTPFHDRRVRLAMTHLIDREHVRRNMYYGLGEIATSPFPPKSPMNNPDIEPWPYDLALARELLAEAGWIDRDGDDVLENEDGEEFEFEFTHASGGTVSPRMAKYLKDQCALVGIRMNIRVVDWSIMSRISDDRDFDAITMQWSHSLPESDPYQLWHSDSMENRGDNAVQFSDPRVDELIERGRRTLDFNERMAIWHELHEILHEEQPYTFTINAPWIRFITKDLANVRPLPIGLLKSEMYFPAPN